MAFTIYALVDLFMTHAPRVRAFPKPLWIVVIVVLPIIGPLLWLRVGKAEPRIKRILGVSKAPDDDPKFLGSLDSESSDERIKRLEDELRKLDEDDPPATGDDGDQDPPLTRS